MNLARCLSACYRYRGRQFNSNRRQVETCARRKPGLSFCIYLPIWFSTCSTGPAPQWDLCLVTVGGGLILCMQLGSALFRLPIVPYIPQSFYSTFHTLYLSHMNLSFPRYYRFVASTFYFDTGRHHTPLLRKPVAHGNRQRG